MNKLLLVTALCAYQPTQSIDSTSSAMTMQKDGILIDECIPNNQGINGLLIGQTFQAAVSGSIGSDTVITFDIPEYFSKGVVTPKEIIGGTNFRTYTALKPGTVTVTAQHMLRGQKQSDPQSYIFTIIDNQNKESIPDNHELVGANRLFSESIGMTVEGSEEEVQDLNSVFDETNMIENAVDKVLK